MTITVRIFSGVISTVRKHIVPQETLACAGVGVGVEEALNDGVVISALEVVEARLRTSLVPVSEKKLNQITRINREMNRHWEWNHCQQR